MLSASNKRKYVLERILELVSPYGFFMRYGALWKYSIDGENVMCIVCDIACGGGIRDIEIDFGTFYANMEIYSICGKKLFPGNGFDFQFYMHSTGISKPIFSSFVPLEEQVDRLIPLFKDVMIPLMPTNDSLLEFLHKEEQLLQCVTKIFNGQPRMTDISELVYAYLSLDLPQEAMRVANYYASQCEYVFSHPNDYPDEIKYNVEKWKNIWVKRYENALSLCRAIANGNQELLEAQMHKRKETSLNMCKQFFHVK